MRTVHSSNTIVRAPWCPSLEQVPAVLLAYLASQSLIAEAELTPKPGLVDRRGPGAHTDLSLSIMKLSALAIEPYFREMAFVSEGSHPSQALRERLALIGRDADRATPRLVSHGDIVTKRYGATGARGEALGGFPHVVDIGLPTLRAKRAKGATESVARLDTLLSIMARLDDTCLLYRGGEGSLLTAKAGAAAVERAGGSGTEIGRQKLFHLDRRLLELGVSPGGCGDLLAATLFLDAVERRQEEVQADRSGSEDQDGAD